MPVAYSYFHEPPILANAPTHEAPDADNLEEFPLAAAKHYHHTLGGLHQLFFQSLDYRGPKYVTLWRNHCVRRAILPLKGWGENLFMAASNLDGWKPSLLVLCPVTLMSAFSHHTAFYFSIFINLPLSPSNKMYGVAFRGQSPQIRIIFPYQNLDLYLQNQFISEKSFSYHEGEHGK